MAALPALPPATRESPHCSHSVMGMMALGIGAVPVKCLVACCCHCSSCFRLYTLLLKCLAPLHDDPRVEVKPQKTSYSVVKKKGSFSSKIRNQHACPPLLSLLLNWLLELLVRAIWNNRKQWNMSQLEMESDTASSCNIYFLLIWLFI